MATAFNPAFTGAMLAPARIDGRAAVRWPISLLASIRSSSGEKFTVEMADVSAAGCQVRRTAELEEGSAILLTIPAFTSFSGTVVWVEEDAMGVRFDKRLHPAILDRIIGMSDG